MQLGIIGGIGPAATDYYYRKLVNKFSSENKLLDMTIAHANTSTLLNNIKNGNIAAQVDIYSHLTNRLLKAGASCVAITSIAGHFCINEFSKISPLPVVNILSSVENEIERKRYKKVGILGTKNVMESKFYSGISSAEVLSPSKQLLNEVHLAYVEMARTGNASNEQKAIFDKACDQFLNKMKVDAIMLGGTDLSLVYSKEVCNFEVVDCAEIHVEALFDYFYQTKQTVKKNNC